MISIGKLHPLIIHLPIGIMVFAAILFLLKKIKRTENYDRSIELALGMSLLSAAIAILTGFLLADTGGYDDNSLSNHKWLGIATAISLVPLYLLVRTGSFGTITNVLFIATFSLVVLTGHLGGVLTHGANYLTSTDKVVRRAFENVEQIPVYEGLVMPILQKRCTTCHNPSKKKGDLIMTNLDGLMAGGESGSALDLDNPEQSEILRRIHLPLVHDEHMPPEGKQQMEEDEIALLEWWIARGACTDCTYGDVESKETYSHLLVRYELIANPRHEGVEPLTDRQIDMLTSSGIDITSITDTDPFVSISLSGRDQISNKAISALRKVRENVLEINLANSTLNRKLIGAIEMCTNLEMLQLQHTNVVDSDISQISDMPALRTLNIYGTQVTDGAVEDITNMPSLQRLYCWQAGITPDGIKRLTANRPALEILAGPDTSIFEVGQLHPPAILASAHWFTDTVTVTIKTSVRNSTIHYTLDGSKPDTNSARYNGPLTLSSSHRINAITNKSGWRSSDISNTSVIKTSHAISDIRLTSQPDDQYAGHGGNTLIDRQKGSSDFRDGKWLGYQGRHVVATVTLDNPDSISQVFVSALSDPASWIFYPAAVNVELSMDGQNYVLVQTLNTARDHRTGSEAHIFNVTFPAQIAQYVRIEIQGILENPDWHPVPGGDAWVFIDEVLID